MKEFRQRFHNPFLVMTEGGAGGSGDAEKDNMLNSYRKALTRANEDAGKLAQDLFAENYQLREQKRILKSEVDTLKGSQAEGSITLTKEQAADWTAYLALGKPKEITTKLENMTALEAKQKETEKRDQIKEAAGFAKLNADVLFDLAVLRGFELRVDKVKTKDGAGKEIEVAEVVVLNADKTTTPIAEYVDKNLASFKPALSAVAGTNQSVNHAGGHSADSNPGVWIQNNAGGASATQGQNSGGPLADEFLKKRNDEREKAPNPLAPKTTSAPA